MKLRGVGLIAAFVLLVLAGAAGAVGTGGSMGGGHFSSGGGGGHYSGGGGHSSYSSYGGSSHGSGGGCDFGAPGIIVFVLIFGFASLMNNVSAAKSAPSGGAPATDSVDLTVLRVGIDARARKGLQQQLARIAEVSNTATDEGRARMLREVALALRRLRDAWIYGGATNFPLMRARDAEVAFNRNVDDARSKFMTDTVRNEQGVITRAAGPELHSTTDDGPGVVLLSVIVAARNPLFTVNWLEDGEDLRKALESLSHMVSWDLVAVEIVWMPSAEDERVSSIALEAAYPRPLLVPIKGALVGKVFCEYCGSPYPAESISCPSCGGRSRAA